jgi:Uma2 family endonuclease
VSVAIERPVIWDAVRLAERYGPIPLDRIRTRPPPGLATVEDVIWLSEHEDRLYELVEGVLIEKTNDRYAKYRKLIWDAEKLAARFGPIPLDRICTEPPPGLGTEEDIIRFNERENRLFELVDGVLVEKTMGAYESMLAVEIASLLRNFVKPRKLGTVLGSDGMLTVLPGLVRIPDVAFLSMRKFPSGRFPRDKAPPLAPDLAVEVLSESNTRKEMSDKLQDYFSAGSQLVWYVDPDRREVTVFTSPTASRVVNEQGAVDGGEVLPGFTMSVAELFAELPLEDET